MPPPPDESVGYQLNVRNVPYNFMIISTITIIVVLFSSIIPSFRILKINIAKALRG
jgi:ABC-type antimicrobial peptide transport system permease subunit